MRYLSIILAAGLIVLAVSCNDGLMDRSSLNMDEVDWSTVEENVFLGENNTKEYSHDGCGLYIGAFPSWYEALKDRYRLNFLIASDQYYVQIRLQGDHSFPINEEGVISFHHFVTAGECLVFPKEKALNGPFLGELSDSFPCKLLIDCDARLDGGALTFEPGEYGVPEGGTLSGSIQIKMLTEERDKYSFSFNKLTPYLGNKEWTLLCTGDGDW